MRPDRGANSAADSRSQRILESRQKDLTLPRRAWLWERYARYSYLLGVLLFDLVAAGIVLQFGTGLPPETWQYALAAVIVIVLLYPEYLGYRRLWLLEPSE